MAEAVITRACIGGSGGEVSNETKQMLGLNNSATLDDCLLSLGLKDSNYATIICTVLNPDGSPVVDSNVSMVDVGGASYTYSTNEEGKCLFKTNAGSANFTDKCDYFDLYTNEVKVDCFVGSVSQITLQRNIYGNGYNKAYTQNGSIKFSKFINTVDVIVIGGGGQGGLTGYSEKINSSSGSNQSYMSIEAGGGGCGYAGSVNIVNGYSITPDINYNITRGKGGGSTGKTLIDYDGIYRESRDHSSMSAAGNKPGSGSSGGTSVFNNISATGGAGGNNSTGYNTQYPNNYSGRVTGYAYGNGGYDTWGGYIYYNRAYAKESNTNGSGWLYTRSVDTWGYSYGGNNGAVLLNNFQYKNF